MVFVLNFFLSFASKKKIKHYKMKTKKTIIYLFAIAIMATFFTNCTKEGVTGPAGTNGNNGAVGPTGPLSSGNLYGYVKKFDQYGNALFTGLNGVKVNLIGTNLSLNAVTDSTGKYAFDSIATGNYQLAYSDSLFGGNYVSNEEFLGGGGSDVKNINISAIPSYYVSALTLTPTNDTLVVNGTMNAASPYPVNVILYFGLTSSTSSAPANYINYYTKALAVNATAFKINILPIDMINAGIASGTRIYVAAYGIAVGFANNSSYEDFGTGKTVFTGLSTQVDTTSAARP
jgi:hypothetical protein